MGGQYHQQSLFENQKFILVGMTFWQTRRLSIAGFATRERWRTFSFFSIPKPDIVLVFTVIKWYEVFQVEWANGVGYGMDPVHQTSGNVRRL